MKLIENKSARDDQIYDLYDFDFPEGNMLLSTD